MPTVAVYDITNNKVGDIDLNESIFGVEMNAGLLHQAVVMQLASQRLGNHATKTRGMVRGGGRKPYRQKGTGHARQGTIRAPHYTGGGVVFGPHTRSYAYRVNSKVVKLAMRSALSGKLADGELIVVDDFKFEKASTKAAKAALQALGVKGRVTVVVDDEDVNSFLSFRNLEGVLVIGKTESNCYDLLDNGTLVMTKAAVQYVEEVLS